MSSGRQPPIAGRFPARLRSGRDALPGTIVAVKERPVSTLVRLEIAPGLVISAVITTDAAADMGLAAGKKAYAVIKASSTLVVVD